ncbi:acyl-CoA dehydrogenase [Streptosporangium becharense]|uniref:Acyl-[acyl-carrier-protein] dehydrogenase MbtN n=1 Tax=Streptosporangium becharense TaxID=1816182 RepID=A0A7W9IJ47_9ACTN|nr:acyl-CoA dehydrogenase family protein [Streptosporangium becharense]MBB2911238.1 acyl-CoA dehydrogenase [Streptosporangium becharense]MBB5821704.1 acyl-CoA dehydrogenase [Streptosporangium becharense]
MSYASPWIIGDVALLGETARRFLAAEAVPRQPEWEARRCVDRGFWREAGEIGLLCAGVPETYGGGGGTFAHDLVILQEQARALEHGFGNPVHSGIVAHYLASFGTEEQKLRWLPGMASGEVVAAIAMSEPGAGSDLQSITTRAVRDGDEYVIDGAKTFITNGGSCDLVVVVASTDPPRRARGISLFLVDADTPGFRRGRVLDKIGQHGADTAELFFDEVRVPVGALLGGVEGQGFVQLMRQLPQERLIIAVMAVTAAEQALEQTVRYVKERHVFGEPLFNKQNTRFELAECATLTHAGRVFADSCVERHLRGELDSATASMAKWWLSEVQCQVVDRCLQLFGGYGYMREFPIARMYADARAQKIYGGANEVMKELIARSL